jgi:hypothetical protein
MKEKWMSNDDEHNGPYFLHPQKQQHPSHNTLFDEGEMDEQVR